MEQAIEQVNLEQIAILIEQLREKDATLADTIKNQIDQFDYEKVLVSIQ